MKKTLLKILAAVLCMVFAVGMVSGIVTACVNMSEGNTGAGSETSRCVCYGYSYSYT